MDRGVELLDDALEKSCSYSHKPIRENILMNVGGLSNIMLVVGLENESKHCEGHYIAHIC